MVLPTFTAGRRVRASELAALVTQINTNTATMAVPSASNADATSRTTNSGSFTTTLSPANICGTSFTAPPSGIVSVAWKCTLANSGANYTACSPEVRAGGSVGSGAVFLAASDDRTVSTDSTVFEGQGATTRVTGLTAGSTYNVALTHRIGSGVGTFLRREVSVTPLLA